LPDGAATHQHGERRISVIL
jgi:hypothetical protein